MLHVRFQQQPGRDGLQHEALERAALPVPLDALDDRAAEGRA